MNSISIIRFSFGLVIWLACSSLSASAQEIVWQTNLEQAIEQAKQEEKLVLLHFSATWSKSCQDLQTFVYTSPQVQRLIATNVIPVQIDVDEQVELTSQYGIGKVPYDIVITPSKRIIVRRESPKEAVAYSLMISRLEKVIQQMAQPGSSTLDQNLDDFQALMQKAAPPIKQYESITPDSRNHQAAAVSQDSQELNRKFVSNPAYSQKLAAEKAANLNAANLNAATLKPEPQASSKAPASNENKTTTPGPLKIINPNFFAGANASGNRPLTNATMQPNLQRPPALIEPGLQNARPKPIIKADLIVNPTAAATDFKAEIPSTSTSSTETPAELKVPAMRVEKLLTEPPQATTLVGLQGKCPVTLIREARWVPGFKQWGCVHRDQTYLFASEANLQTFLADPDAYSPLLAGFDPVVFDRTGQLVPGLEEHGVFMGTAPKIRVVLFSNKETRREFETNPKKYVLTIREAMENSGGGSSTVEH